MLLLVVLVVVVVAVLSVPVGSSVLPLPVGGGGHGQSRRGRRYRRCQSPVLSCGELALLQMGIDRFLPNWGLHRYLAMRRGRSPLCNFGTG